MNREMLTMNKRCLLLIMVISSAFNLIFVVGAIITPRTAGIWLFPELGVAVVQDAYTIRVPALESPFGMIGDIPGGYTPYLGSPYLDVNTEDIQQWVITAG